MYIYIYISLGNFWIPQTLRLSLPHNHWIDWDKALNLWRCLKTECYAQSPWFALTTLRMVTAVLWNMIGEMAEILPPHCVFFFRTQRV